MAPSRQLRLGAFMRPVGIHTAWWRYPGGFPDANFNFAHLKRFAQKLEQGRFDAFFMADHLALLNMPMSALKRSATATSFDPLTLLPALAVVTERLGLIATASTTYNEPYHVARKFASLDHLSGGRAGWNLVTTSNPEAALNFGLDQHVEHGERYRRGREFFEVVTGLWDSWADDAFVMDVESGIFFDPEKLHVLGHKGEHFSVRGPLNVARPIQGWPVIVQAGASEAGRQIAAETAEVVFGSSRTLADAQAFYRDVKGRMERLGRSPDHLKILPGALVFVGATQEEALAKKRLLDSLVHPDSGVPNLSMRLGVDASGFDLDGPLPEIPGDQRQQERPAEPDRPRPAREPDRGPAGEHRRRLWRPGDGGHPRHHRRPDGGVARRRGLRRLQRHVPLRARRPGRLRRPRRAGAAAARAVPPRVRGRDPAREPGPAPAAKPLLRQGLSGHGNRATPAQARART